MLKFIKKMLGIDWLEYKINSITEVSATNASLAAEFEKQIADIQNSISKLSNEFEEFKKYVDDRLSYETEELTCEVNDSLTKVTSNISDVVRDMEVDVKIIKDKLGIIDSDIITICNEIYTKYSTYDITLQVEKWTGFLRGKNAREQKVYLKELKKKNGALAGQAKNALDNLK